MTTDTFDEGEIAARRERDRQLALRAEEQRRAAEEAARRAEEAADEAARAQALEDERLAREREAAAQRALQARRRLDEDTVVDLPETREQPAGPTAQELQAERDRIAQEQARLQLEQDQRETERASREALARLQVEREQKALQERAAQGVSLVSSIPADTLQGQATWLENRQAQLASTISRYESGDSQIDFEDLSGSIDLFNRQLQEFQSSTEQYNSLINELNTELTRRVEEINRALQIASDADARILQLELDELSEASNLLNQNIANLETEAERQEFLRLVETQLGDIEEGDEVTAIAEAISAVPIVDISSGRLGQTDLAFAEQQAPQILQTTLNSGENFNVLVSQNYADLEDVYGEEAEQARQHIRERLQEQGINLGFVPRSNAEIEAALNNEVDKYITNVNQEYNRLYSEIVDTAKKEYLQAATDEYIAQGGSTSLSLEDYLDQLSREFDNNVEDLGIISREEYIRSYLESEAGNNPTFIDRAVSGGIISSDIRSRLSPGELNNWERALLAGATLAELTALFVLTAGVGNATGAGARALSSTARAGANRGVQLIRRVRALRGTTPQARQRFLSSLGPGEKEAFLLGLREPRFFVPEGVRTFSTIATRPPGPVGAGNILPPLPSNIYRQFSNYQTAVLDATRNPTTANIALVNSIGLALEQTLNETITENVTVEDLANSYTEELQRGRIEILEAPTDPDKLTLEERRAIEQGTYRPSRRPTPAISTQNIPDIITTPSHIPTIPETVPITRRQSGVGVGISVSSGLSPLVSPQIGSQPSTQSLPESGANPSIQPQPQPDPQPEPEPSPFIQPQPTPTQPTPRQQIRQVPRPSIPRGSRPPTGSRIRPRILPRLPDSDSISEVRRSRRRIIGVTWKQGEIHISIIAPFTESDIRYSPTPFGNLTKVRNARAAWNWIRRQGYQIDAETYDEWASWFDSSTDISNEPTPPTDANAMNKFYWG